MTDKEKIDFLQATLKLMVLLAHANGVKEFKDISAKIRKESNVGELEVVLIKHASTPVAVIEKALSI